MPRVGCSRSCVVISLTDMATSMTFFDDFARWTHGRMSAMIARVPGHDRAAHLPKRHHGDEEGVMFLPSVDANLTVCQSGLTRSGGVGGLGKRRWVHADAHGYARIDPCRR